MNIFLQNLHFTMMYETLQIMKYPLIYRDIYVLHRGALRERDGLTFGQCLKIWILKRDLIILHVQLGFCTLTW